MKQFLLMLTFMTRVPVKTKFEFNDDDFRRGIWFMPVIGLLIGLFLYAVAFLISDYLSPYITALVMILLYIFVTGGLHIDGLADTCDAIYSCRSKERMLEIMKDSRIGTFGVIAIILYIVGMILLLAEVPQACLLFALVGRSMSLFASSFSSYARDSGMGKSIIDETKPRHALYAILLTLITAAAVSVFLSDTTFAISFTVSFAAVLISVYFITKSISKKLGGITGDVIGFIIETSSLLYVTIYYAASILLGV